jgi:hypothetical protein
LNWPETTCQIHDSGYEIMITSLKANQNKLWNLILNQNKHYSWIIKLGNENKIETNHEA